jgi:hypothetical protein
VCLCVYLSACVCFLMRFSELLGFMACFVNFAKFLAIFLQIYFALSYLLEPQLYVFWFFFLTSV